MNLNLTPFPDTEREFLCRLLPHRPIFCGAKQRIPKGV